MQSKQIIQDGLWKNNVALVQLLGLCPMLAVTATAINGLGLGLATTLTLVASNISISLIRNIVRAEIRIPVFVMIIAAIVTAIEMSMNAFFHQLYLILGIFIPLIVTNCSIIGRAESFASRNPPLAAALDGLMMGLGFTLVLFTLGSLREIVGSGTWLADAQLMFGPVAQNLPFVLIENYRGFLLAILPPGAFIGMGLLIALKNIADKKLQERRIPVAGPAVAETA